MWLFILIFVAVPMVLLAFNIARMISAKWMERWQAKVVVREVTRSDDGCRLNIQAVMVSGEGGISAAEVEMEGDEAYVSFDMTSSGGRREIDIEIDLTRGCRVVYFSDRGSSYLMMLKRSESGEWQDVSKGYIYAERDEAQCPEYEEDKTMADY